MRRSFHPGIKNVFRSGHQVYQALSERKIRQGSSLARKNVLGADFRRQERFLSDGNWCWDFTVKYLQIRRSTDLADDIELNGILSGQRSLQIVLQTAHQLTAGLLAQKKSDAGGGYRQGDRPIARSGRLHVHRRDAEGSTEGHSRSRAVLAVAERTAGGKTVDCQWGYWGAGEGTAC